jgi:hypothetical protein
MRAPPPIPVRPTVNPTISPATATSGSMFTRGVRLEKAHLQCQSSAETLVLGRPFARKGVCYGAGDLTGLGDRQLTGPRTICDPTAMPQPFARGTMRS